MIFVFTLTNSMKLLFLSFFFIFSPLLQGQVVADIKFTGIRRMNVAFLEKLIKTKKEQALDSLLLQNDIQILNRLNGISNAIFTVTNVENSNLVNITFLITENYSLIPALNIATTQTNGAYRFGFGAVGDRLAVHHRTKGLYPAPGYRRNLR